MSTKRGANSRNAPRIFCIGVHKTGTTTLAVLAKQLGIPSKHNTRWPSQKKHAPGTLFSDGGAHFEWDRGENRTTRDLLENTIGHASC